MNCTYDENLICRACCQPAVIGPSGRPANRNCPAHQDPLQPPRAVRSPSIFRAAVNFVGALIDFAADGCETVDRPEYERRLSICNPCDYRDGNSCVACKCNLPIKARGRAWKCELGYWDAPPHAPSLVEKPTPITLRFPHGLGDHVQFRIVLAHLAARRPDLVITVASKHPALFAGLVASSIYLDEAGPAGPGHIIGFQEPIRSYADSPSTKAERCLREQFDIQPEPKLCRYTLDVPAAAIAAAGAQLAALGIEPGQPFAVMHYDGATARPNKVLPELPVRAAIDRLAERGLAVLLLDREGRCGLRNHPAVTVLEHCPDAMQLAAIATHARLWVGIDSGPNKLAQAAGCPTIIAWTGHHPVHYDPPMPRTLHLVPAHHADLVRGTDAAEALEYFEAHYNHRLYIALAAGLVGAVDAMLAEDAPPAAAMGSANAGRGDASSTPPAAILITGGIGDFFTIDAGLSQAERAAVETVYYATRNHRQIRELIEGLPGWHVTRHEVLADEWTARRCFTSAGDLRRAGYRVPACRDLSIAVAFPRHVEHGSSALAGDAPAGELLPILPADYIAVHPASANERETPPRDFDAADWAALLEWLERTGKTAVVIGQNCDIPEHPRLIKLVDRLSLLETLAVLRGATGFAGCASCWSVLAARLFPAERLAIKASNPHLARWKHVYYAPHRDLSFVVPNLVERLAP